MEVIPSANPNRPAPLPYPRGWFCLASSKELKAGTVATRRLAGEDVVLYRTRGGRVRATRPYCPHLGAHLGFGGRVDGEYLVCPFHGFAYGLDGTCRRRPGGGEPPDAARLSMLPVREANGMVYVWYDERGAEPDWHPPELPEPGCYSVPGQRLLLADTHPQEVAENISDYGHMGPVHGFAETQELLSTRTEGPVRSVRLRALRNLPVVGRVPVEYTVRQFGLGLVLAEVEIAPLGLSMRMWVNPTPVGAWRTQFRVFVCSAVTLPWEPPAAMAAWLVTRCGVAWLAKDVRRDVEIWHRKRYLAEPCLTPDDGPVGELRRWARQFYPRGA
ncbi:Rieske 2Fe-2S domain-containing protein [Streptomyces sp. NPDC049555]|uniref:aromatic ring-hydroxylating oxygenase subunit alpha n=1 Tax=unclassified Streptomyces TaxID=2593676 RepID=UPI0034441D3D